MDDRLLAAAVAVMSGVRAAAEPASPHEPRKPSGKDRSKVKAARKQRPRKPAPKETPHE